MILFKIIAQLFTIAYDIFGTLVVGVLMGLWLDRLFHTKAIFTIVLSILGIIQAFRVILKLGK